MATLKVNNLSYRTLLHQTSVSFSHGTLYAIIGPNGAGKSTFLKAVAKIITPSSGEVLWNEENLHDCCRQHISKIISLVPQNPTVSFDFSTYDLVAMGRYPHNDKIVRTDIIRKAMETVDAWKFRHRTITELSRGEQQRIYIARALVTESPVILLDEPMTALDVNHQLTLWNLLQELARQEKIVAAVVHDLEMAKRFCQEAIVFSKGRSISHGPASETITTTLINTVFV